MHRHAGRLASLVSLTAFAAFASVALAEGPQIVTVPTTVVTKQGDVTVTFADIDAFAQRMPEKERPVFFNNPKRIEQTILNLLQQKTLAAEARKQGLENDLEVKQQLALANDEALARARMAHFKDDMKIPNLEQLAKERYQGHKDDYQEVGRFDVKQVLIKADKHSDADAKALADQVEKEARANPGDFDALIAKYSEDPTHTTNGGVITQANKNRYAPAFAEAAKKLTTPGEIAPVTKSKYGYHVMQLVAREPDKQKTFAEVHDQIVADIRADFVQKAVQQHIDEIRNRPVEADPDVVASLRTRYGSATQLSGDSIMAPPPDASPAH